MGVFFTKTTKKRGSKSFTVVRTNAFAHWALAIVLVVGIGSRYSRFPMIADYAGWAVLVFALVHVYESWPAIKAAWTDKNFEKHGGHLFSARNPLEYWVPD